MSQPPMIPEPQPPMAPNQANPNAYYPGPQYNQPPNGAYLQPYQGAYMQPTVAPKNPGLALLASFFFPGLGSLMNGNVGLGIVIFVSYVIAWITTTILIGFIAVPAVWVWGMVHAYTGAKNWNRARGIVS
ncbi:MAG TPA: hypothetical protein VFG33_38005 [Kribbella sp.]|uniref:hypothetical protein n=1 Tax=Kribbella sp. TaxID=1871183 RepID=UPI002D76ACEF|nr:hypothetical protein [Kribbella sp.]HET6299222.1 hypothetical protein [Kribbella sp.]